MKLHYIAAFIAFTTAFSSLIQAAVPEGEPTYTATVDSDQPVWQGVYELKTGEKAFIVAEGSWSNNGNATGPLGNTGQPKAAKRFVREGYNEFALLGRVDEGFIFQAQAYKDGAAKFELRGPGILNFMVNDGFPKGKPGFLKKLPNAVWNKVSKEGTGFADNTGSLTLKIWVVKE